MATVLVEIILDGDETSPRHLYPIVTKQLELRSEKSSSTIYPLLEPTYVTEDEFYYKTDVIDDVLTPYIEETIIDDLHEASGDICYRVNGGEWKYDKYYFEPDTTWNACIGE